MFQILFQLSISNLVGSIVKSYRHSATDDFVVIGVGYFYYGGRDRLCVALTREDNEEFVALDEIGKVIPQPRSVSIEPQMVRKLITKIRNESKPTPPPQRYQW